MSKPIKLRKSCIDGKSYHQDQLIRFAKIDNTIMFDPDHKLGGRGGYCQKDNDSIEICFKRKLLNRAFRMNIDSETYNKLKEEVTIWQKKQTENQT